MNRESTVKRLRGNNANIQYQLDLAAHSLIQFIGQGRSNKELPPKYNLEQLTTSDEFIYATQTIIATTMALIQFCNGIQRGLEDFLVVLEEYD